MLRLKCYRLQLKKPILEYEENELEDLNLTTVSDVLTNNLTEGNKNDSIEENNQQSVPEFESSDIKSNITNSKDENQIKSIYGPGISSEESQQKLCQVVKETEKKKLSMVTLLTKSIYLRIGHLFCLIQNPFLTTLINI